MGLGVIGNKTRSGIDDKGCSVKLFTAVFYSELSKKVSVQSSLHPSPIFVGLD
jgi:hypothetical protein